MKSPPPGQTSNARGNPWFPSMAQMIYAIGLIYSRSAIRGSSPVPTRHSRALGNATRCGAAVRNAPLQAVNGGIDRGAGRRGRSHGRQTLRSPAGEMARLLWRDQGWQVQTAGVWTRKPVIRFESLTRLSRNRMRTADPFAAGGGWRLLISLYFSIGMGRARLAPGSLFCAALALPARQPVRALAVGKNRFVSTAERSQRQRRTSPPATVGRFPGFFQLSRLTNTSRAWPSCAFERDGAVKGQGPPHFTVLGENPHPKNLDTVPPYAF